MFNSLTVTGNVDIRLSRLSLRQGESKLKMARDQPNQDAILAAARQLHRELWNPRVTLRGAFRERDGELGIILQGKNEKPKLYTFPLETASEQVAA